MTFNCVNGRDFYIEINIRAAINCPDILNSKEIYNVLIITWILLKIVFVKNGI